MSSFRPLTSDVPVRDHLPGLGRLVAKPSRVTTLSSRRSRSAIKASPVLPGRRLATSKYLRNCRSKMP